MAITRRVFLRNGALAVVGTSVVPSFLTRAVYAAQTATGGAGTGAGGKRLVVLFQRGAADGLNIVVPYGEQAYYSMRPSIAIPRPRGSAPPMATARKGDASGSLSPATARFSQPSSVDFTPGVPDSM